MEIMTLIVYFKLEIKKFIWDRLAMAYKTTISIYKQLNVLTIRRQQG